MDSNLGERVADELSWGLEKGFNSFEYEDGDTYVSFSYEYEVDGYYEDDYYNGTGAFVETSTDLTITDCEAWQGDNPIELDTDWIESQFSNNI